MIKRRIPERGDVYWINPNPATGHEMKDWHRFVVITPKEINIHGICMTVPVTSGGKFTRDMGFAVPILGHETNGVAICNYVRSFDLQAREKEKTARYVETLDESTTHAIISHVLSIIDPDI